MSHVTVLGRATLLPGPCRPLQEDPELASGCAGMAIEARTLSGQLAAAPAGMSRWPRLDRYGKALARACEQAVPRALLQAGPPSGLYVASQRSCIESNALFDQGLIEKGPRLASPLLFPYTLPGANASEVAMLLSLGGSYLVFAGGPTAALASVVAAVDAIEDGEAQRILVAAADLLGPEFLRTLCADEMLPEAGDPPLAEAAAALWLGAPNDGAPGPRRLVEVELGPADPDASSWEKLLERLLARVAVAPESLAEIVSTSAGREARRAQALAVERIAPAASFFQLACVSGDAGAALGLLAVLSALEAEAPTLVLASDRGGSMALCVG